MSNHDILHQTGTRIIELDIEGMTCASCVARVERKLGKLDGVEASVNLPLESAHVTVPDNVTDQQIVDTVNATGYKAWIRESRPSPSTAPSADHTHGRETDMLGALESSTEGSAGDGGAVEHDHSNSAPGHDHSDGAGVMRQRASKGGTTEHAEHGAGGGGAAEHDRSNSAPEHDHSAHEDHMHHGPASRQLRPRLIAAAILTVPVFAISMIPALQFPHWGWVAALLALPVVTWAAWPFHRAAAINARHFASTMDTLVSIGVLAAYLYSAWQLFANPMMTEHPGMESTGGMGGGLYFEVAAVVTTFLLLGRYLEANAKAKAGDALKALLNLGAKDATVLRDGVEHKIPAEQLVAGDIFVVRPGEKIATDGLVTSGSSAVDASLVTGESVPVEVGPGSQVTGATINTSGRLLVRATRVGSETTLAQMGRLVSQAQTGKAPIARLADRISAVFVPVVLVIALVTFVVWLALSGDLNASFTAAVAVLVIACPCALGLATPVGLLTGTGRGAQLGILIKGPQVLEDTRTVDAILLDKTGTVTSGKLAVGHTLALNGHSPADVLSLAGAVEAASEHPIAHAIAAAAKSAMPDAGPLLAVKDFSSAPGGGVRGMVALNGAGNGTERTVVAGRTGWLELNGIFPDDAQRRALATEEAGGATAIWVAVDGEPAGIVSLRDTVKAGSAAAIAKLKELGIRPLLLTGDNAAVAAQVATAVGISPEDVFAGVLPEGKVDAVRMLQSQGSTVAMAGDGVNDAAALAQADLGIAMGSGTDVAIEASDLTVMGSDLGQLVQAIELSRKTLATIKTNLFWAFFYNAIGIPVAALGLLNPMIAGAAMAASSVLVVANSLRLRSFAK
ncbi:Cu+-exporting ATPase [Arthrobacter bambusae]|uniref:Cation-transporting P-type ATPase B n=2 Tax=Arthrobacter bambusae TaxID=1338426 RepID=A0AAW8DJV6_9MICC|nr:heavy metal translocating P-type ATPase [Arthrobacter bambusae]MDP9906930.1 Cu+-exporting ATPase [Arthrobacter bambusae]MDQ0131086.1 Cu+-exporting ATPase [Arthrobacter bambusae]MDQ0182608.1 Cu+-exporting ATPase [Arthrobacter bambusae]